VRRARQCILPERDEAEGSGSIGPSWQASLPAQFMSAWQGGTSWAARSPWSYVSTCMICLTPCRPLISGGVCIGARGHNQPSLACTPLDRGEPGHTGLFAWLPRNAGPLPTRIVMMWWMAWLWELNGSPVTNPTSSALLRIGPNGSSTEPRLCNFGAVGAILTCTCSTLGDMYPLQCSHPENCSAWSSKKMK
jgi:hypothetical protein